MLVNHCIEVGPKPITTTRAIIIIIINEEAIFCDVNHGGISCHNVPTETDTCLLCMTVIVVIVIIISFDTIAVVFVVTFLLLLINTETCPVPQCLLGLARSYFLI